MLEICVPQLKSAPPLQHTHPHTPITALIPSFSMAVFGILLCFIALVVCVEHWYLSVSGPRKSAPGPEQVSVMVRDISEIF